MEITIKIEGMSCGGCVASVEQALKNLSGVSGVRVSLEEKQATVNFDAAQLAEAQIRSAITGAGFDLA